MGGGLRGEVKFKFNPKEYSIQKSAQWTRTPAKAAQQTATAEFTGSDPRSMSLEMFLDQTDSPSGDVTQDVNKLFECLAPTQPSIDAGTPSPPSVRFRWGEAGENFKACVKSVNAKYTLFRPDGKPIRAVCTVSLEEVPEAPGSQNPTSGGPGGHRSHMVVAGDTLHSIAYAEYRSPQRWRIIAEANGIDDPMRLREGMRLLVPSPGESASVGRPATGGR